MTVCVTSPGHHDVMWLCVLLLLTTVSVASSAQELLTNPGFESGTTGWFSDGFNMQTSTEQVHGGLVSVKCTARWVDAL